MLFTHHAQAYTPNVVVTIKPLHGLMTALMKGTDQAPVLLLPNGASPHHYSLRPSDLHELNNAEIIIRADSSLESFLDKIISSMNNPPDLISMSELPGMQRIPLRAGQAHEHQTSESNNDPHAWLSPLNALTFVNRMTVLLAEEDPDNAQLYARNARELNHQLVALDQHIDAELHSVRQQPFLVIHDAYQYFEDHYGLNHAGAFALTPDQQRGLKQISELKQLIRDKNIHCIISEPQYSSRLIRTLSEGSDLRHGIADPLGNLVNRGENAYFELMLNMMDGFKKCLAPKQ